MLSRVADNPVLAGALPGAGPRNIARMARVEHEVMPRERSGDLAQPGQHDGVETSSSGTHWSMLRNLTHSEFLIYSLDNPALAALDTRRPGGWREDCENTSRGRCGRRSTRSTCFSRCASNTSRGTFTSFCSETQRRTQDDPRAVRQHRAERRRGGSGFRCGMYLERGGHGPAESSTRKYHILLPGEDSVGGAFDRFQWTAVLRSASAREAYRRMGKQRG